MAISTEEVRAIFRTDSPIALAPEELLRERGKAFIETMMNEIECFNREENPRFETEYMGEL